MKKAILLLLLFAIVACNDSKKTSEEKVTKNEPKTENLVKELEVTMEFRTNKNAEISLIMNTIKVNEFQTKNIHIVENVIPTTETDKIVANFGPNNISNKMVVSLGKKEEKEFEIMSMSFKYGENIVNIAPKDLNKYFGFSKFSVLDTLTNKIKTIKVGNAHYPKLYVRKKLWDDLKVKL